MMNIDYKSGVFDAPNLEGPEGTHRISWLEWGDPSTATIICVHGLTRNAHDFDFLARALAENYRVIAPDMAGRGDSEYLSHTANYNYASYMTDCIGLLDHLGLESVDWIGTSMGGIIGIMIAALHPGRIKRLVLNDIGSFIPKAGLERIVAYVGDTPESFPTREAAEAHLRRIFISFGVRQEAHWEHLFRHSIKERGGVFTFAFDPHILDPIRDAPIQDIDLSELWDGVTIPALILRGEESDILTDTTAQKMIVGRQNASIHAFPGIGHAPTLLEDEQITVVKNWLG
jgi:pimeloyl-ACP methyl ester carboxylesterase